MSSKYCIFLVIFPPFFSLCIMLCGSKSMDLLFDFQERTVEIRDEKAVNMYVLILLEGSECLLHWSFISCTSCNWNNSVFLYKHIQRHLFWFLREDIEYKIILIVWSLSAVSRDSQAHLNLQFQLNWAPVQGVTSIQRGGGGEGRKKEKVWRFIDFQNMLPK